MEIITSKYRSLYKLKCCLGYIVAIICIIACLNFYRPIYNSDKHIFATIFLIAIICMVIAGSLEISNPSKIIIKPNVLEIHSYFSLWKRQIEYSEIKIIERRKIIHYGKAGQISDGYYVSDITLYDNSRVTVSPDKFENYEELIQNIKINMN